MKKPVIVITALLYCAGLHAQVAADPAPPATNGQNMDVYMAFLKNMGQWDSGILYTGNNADDQVRFLKNGVSFCRTRKDHTKKKNDADPALPRLEKKTPAELMVWNVLFDNSNSGTTVTSSREQPSVFNFVHSADSTQNFLHVPECSDVLYTNVWNYTNVHYYMNENGIKYDVILLPGADPKQAVFSYEGIDSLSVNEKGELVVYTPWFSYNEQSPFAYQLINGSKREVEVHYRITGKNKVGFFITGAYDKNAELIIDPFMMNWASYLRATVSAYSFDIATDKSGNAYTTGWIYGSYPIEPGVSQIGPGASSDAYVAKMNAAGTALDYFTIFGGDQYEEGRGIDVTPTGQAYVTGNTASTNFPAAGAGFGQTFVGYVDVFVCGFNAQGSAFLYSKFLGGTSWDETGKICVDGVTNEVYLTGYTTSAGFPITPGAPFPILAAGDAFITKIDNTGTNILYSTFYGGSGLEKGNDIYIGPQGDIYIVGVTSSKDFPLAGNSFQTGLGVGNTNNILYQDCFWAKFNPAGALVLSTYYGGEWSDEAEAIFVNNNDEVFIGGATESTFNIASPGCLQPARNGLQDAFFAAFDGISGTRIYGTYIGGNFWGERVNGITANSAGEAYVTGYTPCSDFPTANTTFQTTFGGGSDIFLCHINAAGTGFACGGSTFIGGGDSDYRDPRVDLRFVGGTDQLTINGTSHSVNFPTTPGSYEPTKVNGTYDQPVILRVSLALPVVTLSGLPNSMCVNAGAVTLTGTPSGGTYSGAGVSGNQFNPAQAGTGTSIVTYTYTNTNGCTNQATQSVTVYPLPIVSFTGLPSPVCRFSTPLTLTGSPSGGTFSGPGMSGNVFTPNTVGTFTVTYTYTDPNGCTASSSSTVQVKSVPLMGVTANPSTLCYGDASAYSQLNASGTFISFTWAPGASLNNPLISNPVAQPSVTTTYTVTGTATNGCTVQGTTTVQVQPTPFTLGPDLQVCKGTVVTLGSGVYNIPSQYTYTWYTVLPNGSSGAVLGNASTLNINVNWTLLSPTRTYRLCIKHNASGCVYCDDIRVTLIPCLSGNRLMLDSCVADSSGQDLFYVYPVPTNGMLTVEMLSPVADPVSIIVYNQAAQMVYVQKNAVPEQNRVTMDLRELDSGVYFIQATAGSLTRVKQVVIQK